MVEAIISHRPYRPGLGIEKALSIITEEAGTKLNKTYVDACVDVFEKDNFEFKKVSENPFFSLSSAD